MNLKSQQFPLLKTGLSILSALLLSACNLYVDGAYTGTEVGSESQPFRTIARALSVASAGDVVYVRPGLYRENLRLPADVDLISTRTGAAIIHGGAGRSGGNPAVVTAQGASISGFTIIGGYTGIRCQGGRPIIKRNILRGNYGDGGIVALNGCNAAIENNTVLGNFGNSTNGLAIGIYVENATPAVRNNIITGNDIGFAPYQATPIERYNNIWGNRRNFGYQASAGAGTISADPRFMDPSLDDYRLATGSPSRDSGDPAAVYNDSDGSRNDMGAFDANGGYLVDIPTQEYFAESLMNAIDTDTSLRLDGTSRFDANPVFWFDASGRGTQGETDARSLITSAIPILTDGLYTAVFHSGATPPACSRCNYVTVSFDTPQGIVYRRGVDSACRDPGHALQRAGAAIIGGELHLSSSHVTGILGNSSSVATTLHELAHVAGVSHSFRGENIIGQGVICCRTAYSPVERAAFNLLYARPAGTTVNDLIAAGDFTRNTLQPIPSIDHIQRWIADDSRWRDAKTNPTGPDSPDYWARPGDYIILKGSRLTLRWLTEFPTSFRAPDYSPPTIHFGDISVTADIDHQRCPTTPPTTPCATGEPSNTWAGSPARYLKVRVPAGARSGWVMVRARGLESNPVWLEIR